jgi:hypothetical protein
MKKVLNIIIAISIFAAMTIWLSSCEKSARWTVYANITNNTKDAYYLWIDERDKPEPGDKIAPGQFRTISIYFKGYEWDGKAYFDDWLRLHASKDGINQDRETRLPISYNYVVWKSMIIKWTGSIFTVEY